MLKKMIAQAETDIWYLPYLANEDITKYEAIKNANYLESLALLKIKIERIYG